MNPSFKVDIAIRLPRDKKSYKADLEAIAQRNHISVNKLMVYAIEFYLGYRDRRPLG